MALGQQRHYEPYYNDPVSSPAAFVAALSLLLLMFVVVLLLWAPWSGAGDNGGSNPAQTQPALVQPAAPPQSGGVQILPSAPQNPGSTSGR